MNSNEQKSKQTKATEFITEFVLVASKSYLASCYSACRASGCKCFPLELLVGAVRGSPAVVAAAAYPRRAFDRRFDRLKSHTQSVAAGRKTSTRSLRPGEGRLHNSAWRLQRLTELRRPRRRRRRRRRRRSRSARGTRGAGQFLHTTNLHNFNLFYFSF